MKSALEAKKDLLGISQELSDLYFEIISIKELINKIAEDINPKIHEINIAINKLRRDSTSVRAALDNIDKQKATLNSKLKKVNVLISESYKNKDYEIFEKLAGILGYDSDYLKQRKRDREIVYPRMVIAYIMSKEYKVSYTSIGRCIGQKHDVAIYYRKQVEDLIFSKEPLIKELLKKYENSRSRKNGSEDK